MKFKDSKYFKGAISLGLGAILLTTAVFANYESANGYSVAKEALKKVAYAENYSVDITGTIGIDNTDFFKLNNSYKINANGNPSESTETTEEDGGNIYYSKSVTQDDSRIYMYSDYETNEIHGHINRLYSDPAPLVNAFSGEAEVGTKVINFVETLADTMIGDLKNSFVLTSKENGISTYNINLSTEQMPSYVTAGVSMISSIIKNEYDYTDDSDDPTAVLFASGDPYIRDVGAVLSVDEEGNPVKIKGNVNFVGYDSNGNEHIMSVELNLDFYNFGKTEIERVSDELISTFEDYRKPITDENTIYTEID